MKGSMFITAALIFLSHSFVFAQKTNYYFSLNELLSLAQADAGQVKTAVVSKGYDFGEAMSNDTLDFYAESTSKLRTGSNLAKVKISAEPVFRTYVSYSVALQYAEQVNWLRTLNKELIESGYNKKDVTEFSSVFVKNDTSLQVFINIITNRENTQVAHLSVIKLINRDLPLAKQQSAIFFSVEDVEKMISKCKSATAFADFIKSKGFTKTANGYLKETKVGRRTYYVRVVNDNGVITLSSDMLTDFEKYKKQFTASGFQLVPNEKKDEDNFSLKRNGILTTFKNDQPSMAELIARGGEDSGHEFQIVIQQL